MNKVKFDAQFDGIVDLFQDLLDDYEEANPEFIKIAAFEIVYKSILSLRAYLEDPGEEEIDWSSPFVELQYPVEIDEDRFTLLALSEKDMQNPELVSEKLTEAFTFYNETLAFRLLCNDTAYILKGDEYSFVTSQDIQEGFNKLPEEERKQTIKTLQGGEDFDLNLTGSVTDRITGKTKKTKGPLSIHFNPLVIDKDENRAYFPVQTGLFMEGCPPDRWSDKDREDLWETLLNLVEKATPGEKVPKRWAIYPLDYFPAPTLTSQLLPVFQLPQSNNEDVWPEIIKGKVQVRKYMTIKGKSLNLAVQRSFAETDSQEVIEEFEKGLRQTLTPFGFKTFLAVLRDCAQRNGSMFLSINNTLDLLGYKRTKSGYHHAGNRVRLQDTIRTLGEAEFHAEYETKAGKGKDIVTISEPLFIISGRYIREFEDQSGHRSKVDDGVRITLSRTFYNNEIDKRHYTWIPDNLLTINVNQHPNTIPLYTYLVTQIRMRWMTSKNSYTYRGKLKSILHGCGINIRRNDPNRKKKLDRLKSDLDLLVDMGLFVGHRVVEPGRSPLEDMWEITIPENHPLSRINKEKRKLKVLA